MCKAHVLRFCCGHGVLMGFDVCTVPCPVIKTSGWKLPQQPYRCYNCQNRSSMTPVSPRGASCSSAGSLDSNSSTSTAITPPSPIFRKDKMAMAPLPGVARQPLECGDFGLKFNRSQTTSSTKAFSFACSSSSHYPPPHYMNLPAFLPHQNHPCPPCQLEELRIKSDQEAIRSAIAEHPHLTKEMLVHDGRTWEDCQSKPTLEEFMEEKRSDERQMWLHVTRKWTQDLKKARVLVAEEDGLGLLA